VEVGERTLEQFGRREPRAVDRSEVRAEASKRYAGAQPFRHQDLDVPQQSPQLADAPRLRGKHGLENRQRLKQIATRGCEFSVQAHEVAVLRDGAAIRLRAREDRARRGQLVREESCRDDERIPRAEDAVEAGYRAIEQ